MYEEKIRDVQENYKNTIKKRVNASEKKMVSITYSSETKQQELANQAKDIIAKYEAILEQHILEEKNMRSKRSKVEGQLASVLAKFDSEIGDREEQREQIQAE